MLFLPNIANFYIFTAGKQSAWFFTAAFWKVLGNFTFEGLKSIKVEISGRLLYCCCKVGSLNTLMSPTCGKLADRTVEAENWGGEELACWTSGSLLLSMISPVRYREIPDKWHQATKLCFTSPETEFVRSSDLPEILLYFPHPNLAGLFLLNVKISQGRTSLFLRSALVLFHFPLCGVWQS